jgi:hypothetical protein
VKSKGNAGEVGIINVGRRYCGEGFIERLS